MDVSSEFSQEQINLAVFLEGIFMPLTARERAEAVGRSKVDGEDGGYLRFSHYTAASSGLNIINKKRFWMRNAVCMSDYSEIEYGHGVLLEYFKKDKVAEFDAALPPCHRGVFLEVIEMFNKWWGEIKYNTYITSVSEHLKSEDRHGRLSMWRAFGGTSASMAFVFNVPLYSGAAIDLNVLFCPVMYGGGDYYHSSLDAVFAKIGDNADALSGVDRGIIKNTLFNMLVVGVTCLKHEGFREEREWRIIYFPKMRPSKFITSEVNDVGGVPQVVHLLPMAEDSPFPMAEHFEKVILGPSPYPWAMYQAFSDALTSVGVKDAGGKIVASEIPIRAKF
jgi:hypothetical protein